MHRGDALERGAELALYLPHICPISPLYLPYVSPVSPLTLTLTLTLTLQAAPARLTLTLALQAHLHAMFAAEPSLAAVLVDSLDAELEPGLPLQEANPNP